MASVVGSGLTRVNAAGVSAVRPLLAEPFTPVGTPRLRRCRGL